MRVHTEKVETGEEEVVIRYREMTPQIEDIIEYVSSQVPPIIGAIEKEKYILGYNEIYYFESVESRVFAYTRKESYEIKHTLNELENMLQEHKFFRCNKSIIVNIKKIQSLKSNVGNRIDVTLDNQEHLIISRRYAKEFRRCLHEGD
ncbi:LytTR family DNA-binding domain-containing protein [Anaerosporobacter faecicola]|uniref:LytTR family DNA-binding domain-containing protein n=1 Tax=Anaerosporobacter faecicola TaxID=2718714 RepID=UPI00143A20F1|nr:LytTR family DNA-binding domain-containing protein [Anaerosporobacter faecicola]